MPARKLRILHCPENIGSNAQMIAHAERELGLDSHCITFTSHPFGYEADEVLMRSGGSKLALEWHRWHLLWRALRDFDVIHFNFGQTLMPPAPGPHPNYPLLVRIAYNAYSGLFHLRDLNILKRFGKGIVISYQGDDVRQGDFCRANYEITFATEVEPWYYTPESDAAKRRDTAYIARYADRMYALSPDLLHFLPKTAVFIPICPVDLRTWRPVPVSADPNRPIKLVHAPSHRGVKGTRYILDAVERLKSDNIPIELVLIEKMQHAEARHHYEQADLLVDQLLAGYYGGLAVELMALGKPVICYMREADLKLMPSDHRADLPIINATPSTIYDVLKLWTTERRNELPALGRRSRAYVERWHDPLKIAARFKTDYEVITAVQL